MSLKRHAPATARNREPILAVLRRVLPESGLVLEVASGTGEHAAFFAGHLPHLDWQPTDRDDLGCIAAWRAEAGHANLRMPARLDATEWPWPVERADALFCANMIHIAPWRAAEGLLAGGGKVLRGGGVLVLYGPFRIDGRHVSDSNVAFDQSLRAQDPDWGVRDLIEVVTEAARNGLDLVEVVDMPANNRMVVFQKRQAAT